MTESDGSTAAPDIEIVITVVTFGERQKRN
jgi:hypothetical protein